MILARTAIDTIIQSSTVELLHSYGLPVAPGGRLETVPRTHLYESVGIIGFDAPKVAGRLTLSIPTAIFDAYTSGRSQRTTLPDWTRELTNQLMGRLKNRLLQFQVKLRTHLPIVLSGDALERQRNPMVTEICYSFRALRGEVIVTVDPSLATAVLAYSNANVVAQEGELILFD
jgi:hypothetical protein